MLSSYVVRRRNHLSSVVVVVAIVGEKNKIRYDDDQFCSSRARIEETETSVIGRR